METRSKDEVLVSVITYSSCEISWGSSYLISTRRRAIWSRSQASCRGQFRVEFQWIYDSKDAVVAEITTYTVIYVPEPIPSAHNVSIFLHF